MEWITFHKLTTGRPSGQRWHKWPSYNIKFMHPNAPSSAIIIFSLATRGRYLLGAKTQYHLHNSTNDNGIWARVFYFSFSCYRDLEETELLKHNCWYILLEHNSQEIRTGQCPTFHRAGYGLVQFQYKVICNHLVITKERNLINADCIQHYLEWL